METTAASTAVNPRPSAKLLPFLLIYLLLTVLHALFPLAVFGPGHYAGLSIRLAGSPLQLLAELAAPLLFGGLTLAALLLLWSRRGVAGLPIKGALAVRGAGAVIFIALTALCAVLAVYPANHVGYGIGGAPYWAGFALSLLWQAAVATGLAVVPVYVILPALQNKMKPGLAAWAAFGTVLAAQALAMYVFRLWLGKPNLFLLDVLPNAIAPVAIGMVPVMLAILVCQRSRKGSAWPAVFAAAAAPALWALAGPAVGGVLASMDMADSLYLTAVHLVLSVLVLLVFFVMSLTIGRKLRKRTKKA